MEKIKCKKLEVMQPRIKNTANFQLVNTPSRISPHQVVIDQYVHYSLAKNNQEEKREGGLKESGAHYFSSPERHAGGGGGAYLRGGASSRIYGSGIREWRNKSSQSQIQTSVRIFYRGRNFKPYLTGQQAPV